MTTGMSRGVYRMPSLGADMEAGTLIEWVKRPGEPLARGDVIAVVETQKGAIEVEVFQDAVMGRPLVEIGQTVPVGTPLAELEIVGAPGEAAPGPAGDPPEPSPRRPGRSSPLPRGDTPAVGNRGGAVSRASPRLPRRT